MQNKMTKQQVEEALYFMSHQRRMDDHQLRMAGINQVFGAMQSRIEELSDEFDDAIADVDLAGARMRDAIDKL